MQGLLTKLYLLCRNQERKKRRKGAKKNFKFHQEEVKVLLFYFYCYYPWEHEKIRRTEYSSYQNYDDDDAGDEQEVDHESEKNTRIRKFKIFELSSYR